MTATSPFPDPDAHHAAVEWAGALALSLDDLSLQDLQARYEAPDGKQHRVRLKAESPELVRQLVEAVQARVNALKTAGQVAV